MMTYTAVGASIDLEFTNAVDIAVKKDLQGNRAHPHAVRWDNYHYAWSNLAGKIHLTNRRSDTVHLEIHRFVLEHIDRVNHKGLIEHLGRHESGWMEPNTFFSGNSKILCNESRFSASSIHRVQAEKSRYGQKFPINEKKRMKITKKRPNRNQSVTFGWHITHIDNNGS